MIRIQDDRGHVTSSILFKSTLLQTNVMLDSELHSAFFSYAFKETFKKSMLAKATSHFQDDFPTPPRQADKSCNPKQHLYTVPTIINYLQPHTKGRCFTLL